MKQNRREILRSLSVAGTSIGVGSMLSSRAMAESDMPGKADRMDDLQWKEPNEEEIKKYSKKAWNDGHLQLIFEELEEKGCKKTDKGRVRKLRDEGEAEEYYIVTFLLKTPQSNAKAYLRWVSDSELASGEYYPNGTGISDGNIKFVTYTVEEGEVESDERSVTVPTSSNSQVSTQASCGTSVGVGPGSYSCSCPCDDVDWDCIRETILGGAVSGAVCSTVTWHCIVLLLYTTDLLEDCCTSGWNCSFYFG